MSAPERLEDRIATIAGAFALMALALVLLSGGVLAIGMAYSTVDCEFSPKSERCIALDERRAF